jgi:tripartite-type tricarboxylate transporter receptor subunit TctC
MSLWRIVFVCLLSAAATQNTAQAQSYPGKPVRYIVPWPAGGIADSRSRLIAQCVTQSWGQQVVVDNKPGASGTIGVDLMIKSKPDGYTVAFVSANELAIAQAMGIPVPYDAEKDVTPIMQFTRTPIVLVASPALPVDSAQALVAWARAQQGKAVYGSPGIAHTNHFAVEAFNRDAGITGTHVPYKGEASMLPDVIAGRVHYAYAYAGTIEPMVRAGRLKALMVTGAVRSPQLPNVMNSVEAGFPNATMDSWGGLAGPAGLARDIVERLHAEWSKCLKAPEMRARREFQDAQIIASNPQEFVTFLRGERARWNRLVRETGIRPE